MPEKSGHGLSNMGTDTLVGRHTLKRPSVDAKVGMGFPCPVLRFQ